MQTASSLFFLMVTLIVILYVPSLFLFGLREMQECIFSKTNKARTQAEIDPAAQQTKTRSTKNCTLICGHLFRIRENEAQEIDGLQ